jgi:hypothetical protein
MLQYSNIIKNFFAAILRGLSPSILINFFQTGTLPKGPPDGATLLNCLKSPRLANFCKILVFLRWLLKRDQLCGELLLDLLFETVQVVLRGPLVGMP